MNYQAKNALTVSGTAVRLRKRVRQDQRAPVVGYVVAWPPEGFRWPDDVLTQLLGGTSVRFTCPWTSAFDAEKGMRVFLMQSGRSGRGVFASGFVERDSRNQARLAASVDVAWDVFLDPRVASNLLAPSAQLPELQYMTTPEVELSPEARARLEQLWESHVASRDQAAAPWTAEARPGDANAVSTPGQLRAAIERLSPSQPITNSFSLRWRALKKAKRAQQEQKEVWYKTQNEHWLGWLGEYEGPGAYGREDWERTSEFVYNLIVIPQMLIYLAEATGIDPVVVESAAEAALSKRTMMAMAGAIRRILPWSMVEGALRATS